MLYPGIPTIKSLPPIRSKRCTHMISVSFLIMRTQAQRLHACSRWTSTVSSAATPSYQTKNKLINRRETFPENHGPQEVRKRNDTLDGMVSGFEYVHHTKARQTILNSRGFTEWPPCRCPDIHRSPRLTQRLGIIIQVRLNYRKSKYFFTKIAVPGSL